MFLVQDGNINQGCFFLRMTHPNVSDHAVYSWYNIILYSKAPEYLRVLKECDYHQRDEESAALVLNGYSKFAQHYF